MYKGIAFFDLDGVVADCKHRLAYVDDKDKYYAYDAVLADTPIEKGCNLMKMFFNNGYKIIVITSRREMCRKATTDWLEKNKLHFIDLKNDIYMKAPGDTRESWDVKRDLVFKAIKDNEAIAIKNDNYFVDDYPANCEMITNCCPQITPLIFTTRRLNNSQKEEN